MVAALGVAELQSQGADAEDSRGALVPWRFRSPPETIE